MLTFAHKFSWKAADGQTERGTATGTERGREGQDKRRHCLRRAVYIREMMELPSMPPYAASKLWPAVSGFQVDDKFIFLVVSSEL